VPHRLLEIQTIPPLADPALLLAPESNLVVTMPGVAETFKTVMDQMTLGKDFKLSNLFLTENAYLILENPNTGMDDQENQWNTHNVLYDTPTSLAKPRIDSQLTQSGLSFVIFANSHRYNTKYCMGWRPAPNARIGFKLQVTPTRGFHSLYNWCYLTMWLFSGAPKDPEDETVMEKHSADALYVALKSLMHAICPEDKDAQQDTAHWMI
jgi:hypothetical protein